MFYATNSDGEYESVHPSRIARVIDEIAPAVVSVRTSAGDELTITNLSIDARPNGIHLLLDVPEAAVEEE